MTLAATVPAAAPRLAIGRIAIAILVLIGVAGFTALGVWQLERRIWKLALIERVEQRIHATAVPPPGPADWPTVTAAKDEYLRVMATGHFRNDRETLVRASTALGSGYWVLTPFETDQGFTILVNRGFVPPEKRDRASRAGAGVAGETRLTGLLRISEPKGGFLRRNDPAGEQWYSRDVVAIAAARGLHEAAPYFIDADRSATAPDWPRGGLTVINFPNNHLVYALTWFALALTLAGATIAARRAERRGAPSPDASRDIER